MAPLFVFDASPLVAGCQFAVGGQSVAAHGLTGTPVQIPPAVYTEVVTRGGTRPEAVEAARLVREGGIDGGYVRDWGEKKRQFEVIVGKSILAFKREDAEDIPSSKCFGFVQTFDPKSKRRLFEVLKSQGLQMNQQLTFLSDGGDTVRDLQLYLSPEAEHLLDWFHLTMRLTVIQQPAKGRRKTTSDGEETYLLREDVVRELERLKWYLWHGNVYKALQVVESVEMDLDAAVANNGNDTTQKVLKAVEEFHTYIANNKGFIPNYGERYRAGERISTGVVESTVNQVVSKRFCKRQQMQWTKRAAHRLLQTRVKTLNHELRVVFRHWYPDFPVEEEEALQAA